MNGFREAVVSVCSTLIFSGGILMLTPKSSERSMRFILSLILILIISSAVSCEKIEPIYPAQEQSRVQAGDQLANEAALQSVEAFLQDNGIQYDNLKVCTDKKDDGSIVISRIEVRVFDSDADIAGLLSLTFKTAEVIAEYE